MLFGKNLKLIALAFAICLAFAVPSYAEFVYSITLDDDTINPVTSEYITRSIDKAAADRAQCLIITLDTPGGLLASTRTIVKKILSSEVPVVVYVAPGGARAGSAGVFITYSSHVAAMAPSTNIGAAHPVEMGGGSRRDSWVPKQERPAEKSQGVAPAENAKSGDDPMDHKILNDTVAFIKTIAQKRNRNSDWAVKSVTESDSITEVDAKAKGVVEFIAHDERDLLAQMDGRVVVVNDRTVTLKTKDAEIRHIPMDDRQKILNILADPNIAYILLILGFYGLLYEFSQPGFGIPGVLGGIFMVLAFFGMQMLPTNYAALALIVLGLLLFIAEAFSPGIGLFTLGGLASLILGSLILFDSPVPFMRVSLPIVLAVAGTTAGITLVLVGAVLRTHRKKAKGGENDLIGEKGTVKSAIAIGEEGKVFVHGTLWNAIADESIPQGERVEVISVDSLTIKVKKL